MADWERKEEWWMRGKDFIVVVKRHESEPSDYQDEGVNRWNVYAYIYPTHPHFSAFQGNDMWQDATACLPLHGGCSFLQYNHDADKITSVQVGCDYHHLYDERYTFMETKEDASAIFFDAQELVDRLASMTPTSAHPGADRG